MEYVRIKQEIEFKKYIEKKWQDRDKKADDFIHQVYGT
jgi:hypothetical protein